MPTTVPCPTCGRPVKWEPASTWRPFCSERCRLIDLGDWLDESHRIPGTPDDPFGDQPEVWSEDLGEASSDRSGEFARDVQEDHPPRH